MNCRSLQVWAGNAARATQERNRTAEPASNYFQVRWVIEPHRRRTYSKRGPGKRGRLALKGPFRPCVPGGFWVLFAGEKYPRRRRRRRKLDAFCQLSPHPPSSSQAAYRSARRKRQASFTPLLVLSPHDPLGWARAGAPRNQTPSPTGEGAFSIT